MRLKSSKVLDDIVHKIIQGVKLPDGRYLNGHQARMNYFNLSQIEYGYVRYRINEITHGAYHTLDEELDEWSDF